MEKATTHRTVVWSLATLLLGSQASPLAAQVPFQPRIAAGYSHSLSLTATGAVASHGENRSGEIGDGTTSRRLSPVYLAPPAGKVWAQVAAGDFRSTALTTTGELYSWGSNGYGQLGTGNYNNRLTPTLLTTPTGSTWVGVAAGYGHTVALTATGSLYTWGANYYGQLGIGSTPATLSQYRIYSATGSPWTQVAAGYNFSLARCADGNLYTWGSNVDGQLGDGTTTSRLSPVPLAPPSGLSWGQVAGGFWSAAALCSDGSLYTWGNNASGQLGNGTVTRLLVPTRLAPPAGLRWEQVAVGYAHMLALCSDGSLYAWGDNYYGQLGDGTNTSRRQPVRVAPPAGKTWVQVAAGYYHSLALASDGQLYTTGYNYSGELGDGTTTSQNCFVRSCNSLATVGAAAPPPLAVVANPFGEEVQVTIEGQPAGAVTLTLYNSSGQLIRTQSYAAASTSPLRLPNLAALPPGLYVLRVRTSRGHQAFQLMH